MAKGLKQNKTKNTKDKASSPFTQKRKLKPSTIVLIVLSVVLAGLAIFVLFDLLIFPKSVHVGSKVRYHFKGCPTSLIAAVMGADGAGNYYGTSSPTSLQDRSNISFCEGNNCSGWYGLHSSWLRPAPHPDTNKPQGIKAARSTESSCATNGDCLGLLDCDLSDPEQISSDNGYLYSLNCPMLGGSHGYVPSQQWKISGHGNVTDPNATGPVKLRGGPMGCPAFAPGTQHPDDTPVLGPRVPCIQNKCAVWIPDWSKLTPGRGLEQQCESVRTNPHDYKDGKWSVDHDEIWNTWGAPNVNQRQSFLPYGTDGLYVPCDPDTKTCKLYGAEGFNGGKGHYLVQCSVDSDCPAGQSCNLCDPTVDGTPADGCPVDHTTWECPDGTQDHTGKCHVCTGSPAPGNAIRVPFIAEGTVVDKKGDTYTVRWDAVQCQYPYRDGKYLTCRLKRTSQNRAIWKYIFGDADSLTSTSNIKEPQGIPLVKDEHRDPDNSDPTQHQLSPKTAWALPSSGLKKKDLERIHSYSIKDLDQTKYPPLKKGKCVPANKENIFG